MGEFIAEMWINPRGCRKILVPTKQEIAFSQGNTNSILHIDLVLYVCVCERTHWLINVDK